MDPLIAFEARRVRPDAPDVAALLDRHYRLMRAQTPAESCHVMAPSELDKADIEMFGVYQARKLCTIGALKRDGPEGEIKSMHTAQNARGRGAASVLVAALLDHARSLGMARVNLETGSDGEHAAARALYLKAGFEQCPPFGSYKDDPLSFFMTRVL